MCLYEVLLPVNCQVANQFWRLLLTFTLTSFTSALSTTYKRFNERNPKDTNITSSDTLDKITYSSRETGWAYQNDHYKQPTYPEVCVLLITVSHMKMSRCYLTSIPVISANITKPPVFLTEEFNSSYTKEAAWRIYFIY